MGTVLAEIAGTLGVEHALAVTLDAAGAPHVAAQLPAGVAPGELVQPVLDRVRESLAPLTVEDLSRDSLLARDTAVAHRLLARGVHSLLVVPLVVAGQVVALVQ